VNRIYHICQSKLSDIQISCEWIDQQGFTAKSSDYIFTRQRKSSYLYLAIVYGDNKYKPYNLNLQITKYKLQNETKEREHELQPTKIEWSALPTNFCKIMCRETAKRLKAHLTL
jgi:hypothetical protein